MPPFDFDLSASIFSEGDPDIRSYRDGTFRQVLRLGGRLVLVDVTAGGTVDRPQVGVEVRPGPIPPGIRKVAGETVSRLFNLDLDLSPFEREVGADPVMSAMSQRLRGLKPPRTATVFEALIDSITEQQISLTAAHSIERRIVRTFGGTLEVEGHAYFAFPSPERLADASLEELRICGLSGKKAEYINGIARRVREGTLDLENHEPGEETADIIRDLTAIRGVGVWTAELAALRGLSRLDAIPADDLGIRRAISRYYSRESRIDTTEARRIAEAWGRWRGLAAYYLIVAERRGIEVPDPGS
ncbi:MAG TPA: DNA-3-methyladenine glycosylase [Methanomicrobiales archaeon]|nr:DNA-3-methyladenine glycosylase [Methanomicrobiales archaeon]